jgi:hypothetical protein
VALVMYAKFACGPRLDPVVFVTLTPVFAVISIDNMMSLACVVVIGQSAAIPEPVALHPALYALSGLIVPGVEFTISAHWDDPKFTEPNPMFMVAVEVLGATHPITAPYPPNVKPLICVQVCDPLSPISKLEVPPPISQQVR